MSALLIGFAVDNFFDVDDVFQSVVNLTGFRQKHRRHRRNCQSRNQSIANFGQINHRSIRDEMSQTLHGTHYRLFSPESRVNRYGVFVIESVFVILYLLTRADCSYEARADACMRKYST